MNSFSNDIFFQLNPFFINQLEVSDLKPGLTSWSRKRFASPVSAEVSVSVTIRSMSGHFSFFDEADTKKTVSPRYIRCTFDHWLDDKKETELLLLLVQLVLGSHPGPELQGNWQLRWFDEHAAGWWAIDDSIGTLKLWPFPTMAQVSTRQFL